MRSGSFSSVYIIDRTPNYSYRCVFNLRSELVLAT
jgi:hypothetical protein